MKFFNRSTLNIWLPILIIVILVTLGYQLIYATNPFMILFSVLKMTIEEPMINKMAPEIVGINQWLNTSDNQPLNLADLRGQVVLIDFWTYDCINCRHSLPHVVEWDKKYRDQGLVIIGIHTPEFNYERKLENVKREIKAFGIEYPVAIDNGYKTWRAFNNLYWPAKYLINAEGRIVYQRFGEGAYEQTEQKIIELLKEAKNLEIQ